MAHQPHPDPHPQKNCEVQKQINQETKKLC